MTDENLSQSIQAPTGVSKKRISGKLIGIIVGGIVMVLATVAVSFALLSGGGNQPEDV